VPVLNEEESAGMDMNERLHPVTLSSAARTCTPGPALELG